MRTSPLLCLASLVVLLWSGGAWAQGAGSGNALIPYNGVLSNGPQPLNGTYAFRVGLFTSAAATNANCLVGGTAGCGVWADEFGGVTVARGAFSLLLGSSAPLSDAVFTNQGSLWLGVAVRQGTSGPFVVLNGGGPLQRLGSNPFAVRSERAGNFQVTNNLEVAGTARVGGTTTLGGNVLLGAGTAQKRLHVEGGEVRVRSDDNDITPDIAQFMANNLTQGIGVGYDSVQAVGNNANQGIRLVPKGNDSVFVEGPLQSWAVRDTDGATAAYRVQHQRYVVVASYANRQARSFTPIPSSVLRNLCGDSDGCRVTVRMRDWSSSFASRTAVSISMHFDYGVTDPNNNRTVWRREAVAGSANPSVVFGPESGTDNNGVVEHVVRNHDCHFTDGLFTAGTTASTDPDGMGLLNWDASGGNYTPTCELIIDD